MQGILCNLFCATYVDHCLPSDHGMHKLVWILQVLLKFKVPEEIIDKLTRWHRIAMVRKLSSEQAATGVKLGAATLNKFARGQRMSFLQLQQQTREKCQDIWDRQTQSLSMADGDDSESDGEANGDLDSFAGDLENLLEAEEGDEGGGKKGKSKGMGGLGARRRKQLAQLEESLNSVHLCLCQDVLRKMSVHICCRFGTLESKAFLAFI